MAQLAASAIAAYARSSANVRVTPPPEGSVARARSTAPDAKTVELMGEWNGWKSVPMTKGDNGVWTAKVTLSSGTYAYKFLVNGTDWVFDPDSSAKKSVDGIENSAVEIK